MNKPVRLCCGFDRQDDDPADFCDCPRWCTCSDCGHPVGADPVAIVPPVSLILEHLYEGDAVGEGDVVGIEDGNGREIFLWELDHEEPDARDRDYARQVAADLRAIAEALNAHARREAAE